MKREEVMFRIVGLSIGLAFALQSGIAIAAADPMSVYYDNTMESHHPGADPFIHHQIYFNRDGTFNILDNGKITTSGTYVYQPVGDKICSTATMRQGKPVPPSGNPAPC